MVPGRFPVPDVIAAGCGRSREFAVIVHSVRITLDTRAEHQRRLVHVLAPESLSFGAVEGLEVDPVLRIRRYEFIRAYGDKRWIQPPRHRLRGRPLLWRVVSQAST